MRSLHALALTALLCGAFHGLATAQVCDLTTTYASTGGGNSGGAVYFNLVVVQPIAITSFEVNTSTAVGSPIGLQVYTTPTGYNGQIANPGAWTQVAQDNGTGASAGRDLPSPIPLNSLLLLQPGSYGVALVAVNFAHRFTTGTGANQSYSNACLTLNAGAAGNTPFASGFFSPRVWNGTIRCRVATGTFADFTSTTPTGATPLTVSFTDISYTSAPGGVTTWAWDLDGDGQLDSNAQNPNFVYTVCGRFNVTLTAWDGVNPPNTVTKPRYISADPQLLPVADFDANVYGGAPPLTVQFSDLSTGAPSVWSWDFDNDGVPDSAAQNPSWIYAQPGAYTVTLRVQNNCGNDSRTKTNFIHVIANDECTGAFPIGVGLSAAYDNLGSTTSFGWPCAAGGSDLWFSFRAPCRGRFQVNTCTGTNYDSALEVFSGTCASLVSLACNDDSCGLSSSLAFQALGGQTYYIRVGGYASAQGNFRVAIDSLGSGSVTTVSPGCGSATLTNTGSANLATPLVLTVGSTTGTAILWLGLANLGFPICSGCTLGASIDYPFVRSSLSGMVPCDPTLVGGVIFAQAADLGGAGGCPVNSPFAFPIAFTNTLRIQFGN